MPQSGDQVTALPSGWDDPYYDGAKEEVEGTLTIEEVKGDDIFPPFTLYLVAGWPVDPTTIESATNLTAAVDGPQAAGLAVKAKDTGRVLLLQRALTDDDPAAGKWEFPGGNLEPEEDPSEGATREWEEETGLNLPAGTWTGAWTSPNGIYKGYVYEIPEESTLTINQDHEDRKVLNPDDPDGDEIEVIAWFDPADLPENPALREEVKDTDWTVLASATPLKFANPCHSPEDGRFCSTHGEHSGAYRKAYDKLRPTLPDDPANWIPETVATDGMGWTLPNGYPGPKLKAVEKKVTALGKILHNEIVARLNSQGILRPDSKEIKAKDEELRVKLKEAADFLDNLAGSGVQTNALDRFHKMFPGTLWQDGTSEQHEAVSKEIDKEFPGYLKAKKDLAAYHANGRELQDLERTYTLAYRAESMRVLSEVHNGAYGNEDIAVRKTGSTNQKAMETVARAGQVYPDEWVLDANHNGVVTVKPGSRGLHKWEEVSKVDSTGYVKGPDGKIVKIRTSTITVDKVPGYRGIDKSEYYPTAVHEVGHRFEQTRPHIMALEWTFWARRAGNEKPQQLRKLSPDRSYKVDEVAVSDRYEDPYMGKIYRESPSEPFEVFTMGMQGTFGGSYRMWHDSDYSSFILGILAAG